MKKFVIPVLIITIISSMLCFSVTASENEETLLYNLGIINSLNEVPERNVPRIEILKNAVAMLNLQIGTFNSADTVFDDVKADNDKSGYVLFALENGIISSGQFFRPNDDVLYSEAIKMIISTLGYDDLAQKNGGYPYGYLNVAQMLNISDGILVPENEKVTYSDMVKLLYNAVNSELYSKELYVKNGETYYVYDEAEHNLLYQKYGLNVYSAKITKIDGSELKAEIIKKQNKKELDGYKVGEIVNLTIKDGVDVLDSEHTIANIWIDENDVLYHIEINRDIKVITGFVDEINKKHEQGAEYDPRYIETVALKGQEDYIDIAENCEFYFDGKEIFSGGYSYIDAFCRAVLYKDEIISMECYNLKQGGMVTQVDNNVITYSKEENVESKIKNLLSIDNVTVFLNGEKTEIWALLSGVVFDYYIDETENSILIVASSKCVTDTLVSISGDKINFANMQYEISEKFGVYLSDGDKGYTKTLSTSDFLGKTVNAYVDYSGSVRYIGLYNENESNEFYGIITGYSEDVFAEQVSFRLYRIEKGSIIKEEYPLSQKVTYENGANITDIKSAVLTLSSNRDEAIKQAQLVYLFKLNGKSEISSIKKANLFDQCPETGLAITAFSGQSYAYIPTPRIYFRNSDICALYDDNGEIKAKMIAWSDLQYKDATGVNVFLYSDVLSSEIDLVMVRGSVETIAENREEVLKYGILTQKDIEIDSITNEEIYRVTVGPQKFSVIKNMQDIKNINTPSYIEYGKCTTIFAPDEIKVRNIYDLSKETKDWVLSPEGSDGLHYGVLKKNDNVRLYFEDGKAFYMSSGVTFHARRNDGKFIDAEVTDFEVGEEIWYIYRHGEIRAVFFNN